MSYATQLVTYVQPQNDSERDFDLSPTKLQKDNVFTGVCQSFCPREVGYGVLAGNWPPPVTIPVGHRVFAQASCRGIERGQGPTDGWMIVDRMVIHQ